MNDSSQKLPGWLSNDLRPFVYECGLEDKVMELSKEYAKEDILEVLQELLPRDEMVLRSSPRMTGQTNTLPNQSVHSQPAHFKKSISKEGVAKQLGDAEAVLSPQVMPLAPAIPIVASSLMSPMITYSILILFLITIMWFVVGKKYGIYGKKVIPSIFLTGTIFYHLQAFPRLGCMVGGRKFKDRN